MYFLRDLCFLCLSIDQKLVLQCNLSLSILDILEYILPEYNSETQTSICDNCLNNLKNICSFRQKCLQSIKSYNEYVQTIKQDDRSFKYLSIKITDILNNQKCEIFKEIQNVEKIEAETNLHNEIKSEISETNYSDSEIENNEKILGKFEMVEIQVKKEIDKELMVEETLEDVNLFEDDILNSLETHEIKFEGKEGGHIAPNDLNGIGMKRCLSNQFCVYDGCMVQKSQTNEHVHVFYFPTDNEKILEQWLSAVANRSLRALPKSDLQTYFVCSKHFAPRCFSTTKQNTLGPFAVPSSVFPKTKYSDKLPSHEYIEVKKPKFTYGRKHQSNLTHGLSEETENSNNMLDQMVGKLEKAELHVKNEINEEIIMKDDLEEYSNLSVNEISSSSEFHNLVNEKNKDEHILPNDLTEIGSESLHFDSSDGRTRVDTDARPYQCGVCQKTFKCKAQTTRHQRIHTGIKPCKCNICQKSFRNLSDMKRHELTHTDKRPHKCKICQKSFRHLFSMRLHERIHNDEKPHVCKICQKSFRQLSHIRRHERIHTGEKPYSCDICQKSFRQITALKTHERIHTGNKPHVCAMCEKSFSNLSDMKRHELTHSGDKPYSCDICQKSFRQLSAMKTHERIHTGDKPHTCMFCQKAFSDLSAMRRHRSVHSNERPHICDICHKSFKSLSYMRRHKRSHSDNRVA